MAMSKLKSWSEKYYKGLDPWQHDLNNLWFKNMLTALSSSGILIVPNINKAFDKNGKEIK
jgi:hypothetical protein